MSRASRRARVWRRCWRPADACGIPSAAVLRLLAERHDGAFGEAS